MSNGSGRETDATAGLDNTGLLQLQRDVMQDQDDQLEELEKTVTSTRVWVWGVCGCVWGCGVGGYTGNTGFLVCVGV